MQNQQQNGQLSVDGGWEMVEVAYTLVVYFEVMSELDRRRKRMMVEIKRESKEEYFRARRESLLGDGPQPQEKRLHLLSKMSLDRNALVPLIREGSLIPELTEAVDSAVPLKCRYVMAICSNALIDDL
jgi:hypothetical protein